MKLHIGQEIKRVMSKKGWSIVHFADKTGMSYRSALYLFDKTDISLEQLLHLSKVLDYDFMGLFSTGGLQERSVQENVDTKKDFISLNLSLHIGGREALFDRLPELLQKTRKYAEELGFQLL